MCININVPPNVNLKPQTVNQQWTHNKCKRNFSKIRSDKFIYLFWFFLSWQTPPPPLLIGWEISSGQNLSGPHESWKVGFVTAFIKTLEINVMNIAIIFLVTYFQSKLNYCHIFILQLFNLSHHNLLYVNVQSLIL